MYTARQISSYSADSSIKKNGLMIHEVNNNLSCELLFRILLFGWTLIFCAGMIQTILTSETPVVCTLDSDLLYSRLLALYNLVQPVISLRFLEIIISLSRPYCSDPSHSCRGNTLDVLITFVVTVCCSGIKVYMKCVVLVYTGIEVMQNTPTAP